MAKPGSEKVPPQMQSKFDEITKLTDAFCSQYLNSEYAKMSRQLTAALCRKREHLTYAMSINTYGDKRK